MARNDTVADLANWSPPQRLLKTKGRPIVEKLSPLLSRKVVDLDGNVVQQAASNGIANRSPQDPYGQQTHAEKLYGRPRAIKGTPGGILPYSKCPIAIGAGHFLTEYEIPHGAPCALAHNGREISNADPCEHIVALIKARQDAAKARNEETENRINKLVKLQERTAEANLDATKQLAAAAASLAAASQGRSKGGQ
jgi:hypothetical protein